MVQIVGAVLALVGAVLACAPTLVHDPGPAADVFAAIERRIPWGGVGGLGVLLLVHTRLRPWTSTVASAVLWLTAGLLAARVVGLALDGTDDKQWMWVGVEALVAGAAAAYVLHKRRP